MPNLTSAVTAAQAILKNLGWGFCSMAKLIFGLNQSLDGYVDHDHRRLRQVSRSFVTSSSKSAA